MIVQRSGPGRKLAVGCRWKPGPGSRRRPASAVNQDSCRLKNGRLPRKRRIAARCFGHGGARIVLVEVLSIRSITRQVIEDSVPDIPDGLVQPVHGVADLAARGVIAHQSQRCLEVQACGEQLADDVVQARGDRLVVFDQVQAGLGGPAALPSSSACGLPGGGPRVGCTRGTAGAGVAVAAETTPGIRYIAAAPRACMAWLGRAARVRSDGRTHTCIGPVQGGIRSLFQGQLTARPRSRQGRSWLSPLSALGCWRRGSAWDLDRSRLAKCCQVA